MARIIKETELDPVTSAPGKTTTRVISEQELDAPAGTDIDVSRLPYDLAQKVLARTGKKDQSSALGALARGFEGGMTVGGADEIKSAVGAGIAKANELLGGTPNLNEDQTPASFGDLYKEGMNTQNKQLQADMKENPVATIGGEVIGGGLGVGGAAGIAGVAKAAPKTAKYLAESKGFTDAVKKNAIAGGVVGAPAGALSTAPGDDPIEGALEGAGIGAVAAPVIGAGISAARKTAEAVGAVPKIFNRATAGVEPEKVLADKLKNPSESLEKMKSGTISTLSDVGGDSIRGLTRLVGKTEGGRDIVVDALEGRSEDAVSRVVKDLSKVSKVDNYFGNLDDLAAARKEIAGPLYDKAYSLHQNITSPNIDRVLRTPAGQQALARASAKMQNDMTLMGVPDKELTEQARLTGSYGGKVASGLKLRSLDYVKRGFDDMIDTAMRTGEKDNARILTGLKSKLVSEVDAIAPEYKQARDVYSDISSLQSAQEHGADFHTMKPEEISRYLKDASVSEKEAFRIGMRENLQTTASKTADSADPAKRIFGNTYKRDQIKAAFDGDSQFDEFAKRMREEINAADTKFKVIGGSRTDINSGFTDKNLMQKTMDEALDRGLSKTAWIQFVKDEAAKRYYGLTPNNAKKLATILSDRNAGIEALEKLITDQTHPAQARILKDAAKEIAPSMTMAGIAQNIGNKKIPLKINVYSKGSAKAKLGQKTGEYVK